MEKIFPKHLEFIELAPKDGHTNLVAQNARDILSSFASRLIELSVNADVMLQPAVQLLADCRGKLIASGVGKSGIVARKIAANFNCLGLPSVFLHPTEALHGDLGLALPGDVGILVSHSGNTSEIVNLADHLRRRQVVLIGITADSESLLGRSSKVVLNTGVKCEACPNGFLPTTSSLMSTALVEALSIAYMNACSVSISAMKSRHPGGLLGRN
jgi:arabinose-5-phosphate isomerase